MTLFANQPKALVYWSMEIKITHYDYTCKAQHVH